MIDRCPLCLAAFGTGLAVGVGACYVASSWIYFRGSTSCKTREGGGRESAEDKSSTPAHVQATGSVRRFQVR
jgi:hypothetical protein